MPVWVINIFASEELNRVFVLLTLMTLPVWLLMLLAPSSRTVRRIAHPYFLPPLYAGVWFYLIYLMLTITGTPQVDMQTAGYKEARGLVRHPFVFLMVWCQLQVVNLFVGCILLQKANERKIVIPGELIATWFAAPLGLFFFSLRLWLMRLRLK